MEEEGIIYLKMAGTFLAWGHYSTCSSPSFFLKMESQSNSKLKIFIVLSFNFQVLIQAQDGNGHSESPPASTLPRKKRYLIEWMAALSLTDECEESAL